MAVPVDNGTVERLWIETMAIALELDLTPYDAAYIELAGRLTLPLFTYDRKLSSAAVSAGVELL
jgi:predicted nucleic acid-binding protein